jgi:uncharacterized protein YutD
VIRRGLSAIVNNSRTKVDELDSEVLVDYDVFILDIAYGQVSVKSFMMQENRNLRWQIPMVAR